MTPQELKNSILQLAIQGKLVEQRAEEGTAAELYAEIQKEKQKLIKEGKIKKDKPLPEIADDEKPFDIPESWKWVRWGELSESIQYGYNAPAKEHGRIRMVRISDIQEGQVQWNTVPFCDIDEKEIDTYLLKKDDILFARTGGTVGKSFLVKSVPCESIYAGYLIRTRYSANLCPEYLKYFMGSQLYWDQLRSGTIATAQPNCNGQTLSKMILPLPPLAEQKRIVAKIEELLPLIDRYEQAWSKLEDFNKRFPTDMQKSILQMAIEGKLVEQRPEEGTGEELFRQIQAEKQRLIKAGKIKKEKTLPEIAEDEKPFDIPESWMWVRIGELLCLEMGQSPDGNSVSEFCEGIEFHQGKVYFGDKYLKESPQKTTLPTKYADVDSVLLCVRAPVGKVNITSRKICIGRGLCAIKALNDMSVDFTYYWLATLENTFIKQATGTTFVAITGEVVKNQIIPLPPLAEQKRIVEKLNQLLPLCERLK